MRENRRMEREIAEDTEELDEMEGAERETTLFPEEATSWPDGPSVATSSATLDTEAAGSAHTSAFPSVADATTSVSTPTVNEAELSVASEPERATPRLSKREQILARARVNARTPLPESVLQTEQKRRQADEEKLAQEREEEEQVRTSVRERLWKMIGSKWS